MPDTPKPPRKKSRKKPCSFCGHWFVPDPRVGARQRACSQADSGLHDESKPRRDGGHGIGTTSWPAGCWLARRLRHPRLNRCVCHPRWENFPGISRKTSSAS